MNRITPMISRTGLTAIMALVLLLVAVRALAQTGGGFDLSRTVISGGGDTFSSGGAFSVGGTVGDPAAGQDLSGGTFTLAGGFWNGVTNSAPVAVNDTYAVNRGHTLDVAAKGVLANDTDADGNPLTAVLVVNTTAGTLTLNSDGSFKYVHGGSATTIDTFTYNANDRTANSGSATVTIHTLPALLQQGKLTTTDTNVRLMGQSVDISGDTVVAGSPKDSTKGSSAGAAYVFTRSGTQWSQQAKLTAADGAASDEFGTSVAISGNSIVVGSWQDGDGGAASGSAYVFVRSGTTWTQQQKLTAAGAQAGDLFGGAVDIDGNTVAVGARSDNAKGADSGAVHVFTRSTATWSLQQKLHASDADLSEEFGDSVALEADTLIAGKSSVGAGSAYVFTRSGTTWTQQQKLTPSDGGSFDTFGKSVDVSGDTAIVGSPLNDGNSTDKGAAYVFTRSGTTWTLQQKLTAIDKDAVAVGASFDDDKGSASGSTYGFVRKGSTWSQVQKLNDSTGVAGDEFGVSVGVDGTLVVVGAHKDDNSTDSGTAFVFDPASNSAPVAKNDSYSVKEGFAISITTSDSFTYRAGDGTASSNTATVTIKLFSLLVQQANLAAGDAGGGDDFGISVAIDKDTLVVGAGGEDPKSGVDAGAAYVFTRTGTVWSQLSWVRNLTTIRAPIRAQPTSISAVGPPGASKPSWSLATEL